MSTPPGQTPGDHPGDTPSGDPGRPEQDPPTQPMGYWEDQARQQPPPPPGWSATPPGQGYPPPGATYPPGPGYATQPVPDHPRATTALVVGLIALVGGVTCAGLPLVAGPWAWAIGRKAVREIDADPQRYGGRGVAMAGYVLGVVATILLVLGIIAFIALVALLFALPAGTFSEGGTVTSM